MLHKSVLFCQILGKLNRRRRIAPSLREGVSTTGYPFAVSNSYAHLNFALF